MPSRAYRPLLSDTRGGGGCWPAQADTHTHPHQKNRGDFPQAKNAIYLGGWKFEADLVTQTFFWPLIHPPPSRGLGCPPH